MERPKDYYRILGVERDASPAAIKRAYRRLARSLHPDRGPGTSAEAFLEVQQAYETLSDAERRRRYDESLHEPERERREAPPWPFVRGPGASDLRRPMRPGMLSGEIVLTPLEAAAGGVLPLDVPVQTVCPACHGTGGALFNCERCAGEGRIERRLPVPLRIPPFTRDGAVFQVVADEPEVLSILLTVHIRPYDVQL